MGQGYKPQPPVAPAFHWPCPEWCSCMWQRENTFLLTVASDRCGPLKAPQLRSPTCLCGWLLCWAQPSHHHVSVPLPLGRLASCLKAAAPRCCHWLHQQTMEASPAGDSQLTLLGFWLASNAASSQNVGSWKTGFLRVWWQVCLKEIFWLGLVAVTCLN